MLLLLLLCYFLFVFEGVWFVNKLKRVERKTFCCDCFWFYEFGHFFVLFEHFNQNSRLETDSVEMKQISCNISWPLTWTRLLVWPLLPQQPWMKTSLRTCRCVYLLCTSTGGHTGRGLRESECTEMFSIHRGDNSDVMWPTADVRQLWTSFVCYLFVYFARLCFWTSL